jgi:predicted O-methyltransferase YrrM
MAESKLVQSKLVQYNAKYSNVEGWFSEISAAHFDALLCLQGSSNIRGNMFEIGVAHGKSAFLIAMHCRPGEQLNLNDIKEPLLNKVANIIERDGSGALVKRIGEPSSRHRFGGARSPDGALHAY